MNLKIRKMTAVDIGAVWAIEVKVFTDAWSKESFDASLKNENAVMLVAIDDTEQIVGYCCLYSVLDEGEIVNVAVHPQTQRQGVGEKLMQSLLNEARIRGTAHFYLEVRESNIAAQQLYKKYGFGIIGIRKNFYEKPVENALVMMLE